MRKQNSTFQTAFISEAGSELENHDYFAYVELEKYACYVIVDGLNELPNSESARLATQTVILAFQERPSLKKQAILSYLKAADKALCGADKIDFYDERFYEDPYEIDCYWDYGELFPSPRHQQQEFVEELRKRLPQVRCRTGRRERKWETVSTGWRNH